MPGRRLDSRQGHRAPSLVGFQTTSTRLRFGTASRRSASRFPPSSGPGEMVNPVTFAPGRARLATSFCRIRKSVVAAPITIGVVVVASFAAVAAGPPSVMMTSTLRATSSAASAASLSVRPFAARTSKRISA